MKIVLKIQLDNGAVLWILNENESEIDLPEYDGSDNQTVTLNCVEPTKEIK